MAQITSTAEQSLWTRPHVKLEGISPIDHLFNRFSGMYAHRWNSSFTTPVAVSDWKTAWAEAFVEEGVTPHDVLAGLKNCRTMFEWPPSLPEFIKACRPNLSPEIAFGEAVRGMVERNRGNAGVWSHPAIFWAAVRITSHDLMNHGYATLRTRWENALRDVLAAGEWKPIPEAHVQLAAPTSTQADRDEAAKRMRELGAFGVLKPKTIDQRSWAKRILLRAKTKTPPTHAVVLMAQRALGEVAA